MDFTWVTTNPDSFNEHLHFSHLHQYVSAYENTETMQKELREALIDGLRQAKREQRGVIVDRNGEHFFVCNPSGSFDLCIRWKSYVIFEKEGCKCEEISVDKED